MIYWPFLANFAPVLRNWGNKPISEYKTQ